MDAFKTSEIFLGKCFVYLTAHKKGEKPIFVQAHYRGSEVKSLYFTLLTVNKISEEANLNYSFLFSHKIQVWYFLQKVSSVDNMHKM